VEGWSAAGLEAAARGFAAEEKLKLGEVAAPLRAALTGAAVSPGIFEVAEILGRDETLARVADATT
jgi:glutamyl-tRNA synthetase